MPFQKGTEIKNLKEAGKRIEKAIKKRERIILYGDSDLDGVIAVIILKEALRNLGGEISAFYFPDVETEDYGINFNSLESLKKLCPALLISLDLGISNFEEIEYAGKLGFEVIVIDHHEIIDKLPKASLVVDPKQEKDKYPFKQFAASGLSFRLAELLLKERMVDHLRKDLVSLAALATIADMMAQEQDNLDIIEEGIESLPQSYRPAIISLLKEVRGESFNERIQKIIAILNTRNMVANFPASFRLLSSSSEGEADDMIKDFLKRNEMRREKIKELTLDTEDLIARKDEDLIFEGGESFDLDVISAVASRLADKYKKPTFLFKKKKEKSRGAVRSPKGVDVVKAMKACSKYLETYGGHPQAAGFRVKNENIEDFRKCLLEYFSKNI